ncbi:MAG TPA: type II toxin-antitoxin system RelE/ParE family toxin [bacterium]|nr:type II toxin-antitoxin system RelE/ParE family toxin [bacterium]
MAFRARLLDAAARDLARLDRPEARRIVQRINWLASNLGTIRPEALGGDLAGLYKLRVGDYRVIYELLDGDQILLVHVIGHRREIYRRR